MKRILLHLILLISILSVHATIAHQFKIDLSYSQGEITHTALDVKPQEDSQGNLIGEYIAEVLDSNGEVLHVEFFRIPKRVYYDNVDSDSGEITSGGLVELDESKVTLYLPYSQTAHTVVIYDKEVTELYRIDVSDYSSISESEIEQKRPIEKEDTTHKEETQPSTLRNGVMLISGLIFVILFIVRKSKKIKK